MDEETEKTPGQIRKELRECSERIGSQFIVFWITGLLSMIFAYSIGEGIATKDFFEIAWAGTFAGILLGRCFLAWIKYRIALKHAMKLSSRKE